MSDRRKNLGATFWLGAAVVIATGTAVWFRSGLRPAWAFGQQTIAPSWIHLMNPMLWPAWAAYLIALPMALALVYLGWRYLQSTKNSFRRFKELPFLGAVWRWNSLSDLPHALKPVCPSCQGLLSYEELGGRFGNQSQSVALHCEKCESILTEQPGTWKSLQARTAREIHRLIRTGEWRQHVPAHQSRWRLLSRRQPTYAPAPETLMPSGSNYTASPTQASEP